MVLAGEWREWHVESVHAPRSACAVSAHSKNEPLWAAARQQLLLLLSPNAVYLLFVSCS